MATVAKRKRVVLNLEQKLDIINRLENGEKEAVLATEYNVGRSSVADIKMRKDKLLKYASTFASIENMHRRKTMRNAINNELDQAVYGWCLSMKANGNLLSGPLICDKALELNVALGGSSDFKASSGWLKNFKSRHGLDFNISSNEVAVTQRTVINHSVKPVAMSQDADSTSLTLHKVSFLEKPPRVKRKRTVLSLKQKLDILSRLKNGETTSSLAKEYNIGLSSVQEIKIRQHAIMNYVSSFANVDNMYRRKTMKSAYNKELDQAVYCWFVESMQSGQSVTSRNICDKALELNSILGGSSDFQASSGWLQNFKSRHGLFFNDNIAANLCDEVISKQVNLDIYESDVKTNYALGDENANSNLSSDSFPKCDVILNVSNDSDVFMKDLSAEQEFLSNTNNSVLSAFNTVLDWANNQSECTSTDVANLVKLRDLAYAKEMAVAFSSDDSESINRTIANIDNEQRDESFSIEDMYELSRCVEWINSNSFSKVTLQFPDSMLNDATSVALKLGGLTDKQMFVLGDTSYGSCCVDEISAEHVSAEAIIHFGHACLSTTQRLPVLYVFGKQVISIPDVTDTFRKLVTDTKRPVIIIYEVTYSHAIDAVHKNLNEYENLIVSRLEIPGEEAECTTESESNSNFFKITKCHRNIFIPSNDSLSNYEIFYIGSRTVTLTNFMLALRECRFYSYNPSLKQGRVETLDINKHLKKRYYYIERTKDAQIIGILVGTLGASNYLKMIQYLKELIKKAGKKYYTIVVGKLNSAKLANFAEIEVFVNVACVESSLIESKEFYQPIVTPFELEVALNQARKWTGDYITDFSEILPGAIHYISPSNSTEEESDVSLVTGKIRHTGLMCNTQEESILNTELVSRDEMKISAVHYQGAGEFLAQRSWQGLEQQLGETPISKVEEGQSGIASKYEGEKTDGNNL